MHQNHFPFLPISYSNLNLSVSCLAIKNYRANSIVRRQGPNKEKSLFRESKKSMNAMSNPKAASGFLMTTRVKGNAMTAKERKDKKLSFCNKVDIRFIISRQDISTQEHKDTWYSREEHEAISQSCSKQISKLDRGETLKDKKYCARGLECHTRIRTLSKTINRCLAYQAVLEEQDRQHRAGIVHEAALERVYSAISSSCQLWAHAVGLADQREAREILDESREQMPWQNSAPSSLSSGQRPSNLVLRRLELARAA